MRESPSSIPPTYDPIQFRVHLLGRSNSVLSTVSGHTGKQLERYLEKLPYPEPVKLGYRVIVRMCTEADLGFAFSPEAGQMLTALVAKTKNITAENVYEQATFIAACHEEIVELGNRCVQEVVTGLPPERHSYLTLQYILIEFMAHLYSNVMSMGINDRSENLVLKPLNAHMREMLAAEYFRPEHRSRLTNLRKELNELRRMHEGLRQMYRIDRKAAGLTSSDIDDDTPNRHGLYQFFRSTQFPLLIADNLNQLHALVGQDVLVPHDLNNLTTDTWQMMGDRYAHLLAQHATTELTPATVQFGTPTPGMRAPFDLLVDPAAWDEAVWHRAEMQIMPHGVFRTILSDGDRSLLSPGTHDSGHKSTHYIPGGGQLHVSLNGDVTGHGVAATALKIVLGEHGYAVLRAHLLAVTAQLTVAHYDIASPVEVARSAINQGGGYIDNPDQGDRTAGEYIARDFRRRRTLHLDPNTVTVAERQNRQMPLHAVPAHITTLPAGARPTFESYCRAREHVPPLALFAYVYDRTTQKEVMTIDIRGDAISDHAQAYEQLDTILNQLIMQYPPDQYVTRLQTYVRRSQRGNPDIPRKTPSPIIKAKPPQVG